MNPSRAYTNLIWRVPALRAHWPTWSAMLADLGEPRPRQRLGRRDPSRPHGPGNTCWVDTRLSGVARKARSSGISYTALYGRLRRGASLRDATTKPVRHYQRRKTPLEILTESPIP